ncbi:MAG: hypothetical protein KC657_09115 [Myxococcales bacterium]|nr:hypothetical protein [Myxococcales bacterium]
MRTDLRHIVEALVAGAAAGAVSLDDVGAALGAIAVTTAEIESMIDAIEARGVAVRAPRGGEGERHLGRVISASRDLRAELGRVPRVDELAERAGLSAAEVRHALSLARVMQR